MLALWHQTPSMQNAAAGVYQQLGPLFSCCKGVCLWVTRSTRGSRDDTGDTDVGQNEEHGWKGGWGRRVGEGGGGKRLLIDFTGTLAEMEESMLYIRGLVYCSNIVFSPLHLLVSIHAQSLCFIFQDQMFQISFFNNNNNTLEVNGISFVHIIEKCNSFQFVTSTAKVQSKQH